MYYSSNEIGRLIPIFLKAPNNEHKEAMRNMCSCDFPFCDVQNYHGNFGIFVLKYHWIIIEIFRGLFVGTLYDPKVSTHWPTGHPFLQILFVSFMP